MKFLFAFGLVVLSQVVFSQTSYYVSNTGNNTNSGLSITSPFQTFDQAISIATHGDTIFILPGIYTNPTYGTFDIWKSETTFKINNKVGNGTDYLVIKPYQPGSVILKGDGSYIVQIRNSSFIRLEGFEIIGEVDNIPLSLALQYQFTYMDANGTILERVPPGTPTTTIETMTFPVLNNITRPFYFSTMGILAQGSNHVSIINNTVHHMPGTGVRGFECDYLEIRRNTIHNNSRRSSIGNHALVLHSSTSIDNADTNKIFIEQNTVFTNYNEVYSWSENKTFITPHIDEGKGISLQKNSVANGWVHGWMYIANNVCYDNGFSGVHINDGVRAIFANNTCYNNCKSGSGSNIGISSQSSDSVKIYNNIIVTPAWGDAINIPSTPNVEIRKNLVVGVLGNEADLIDLETIFNDPQFVNPSASDFHLQPGSPAIDQAFAAYAPQVDFDGQTRTIADIGAYEYQTNLGLANVQKAFHVSPNPSTGYFKVRCVVKPKSIQVFALTGQKLEIEISWYNDFEFQLNLDQVREGMYLLQLDGQVIPIIRN